MQNGKLILKWCCISKYKALKYKLKNVYKHVRYNI